MRRNKAEEVPLPEITLRPATPRHTDRQMPASEGDRALPIDPDAEARAAMTITALGRIQVSLDILLRRVERIDDRLAALESGVNPSGRPAPSRRLSNVQLGEDQPQSE